MSLWKPLPIDVPQLQVLRYLPLCRLLIAIDTKRLSLTLLNNYSKDDPYETSVSESVAQADAQITNAGQTSDVANELATGRCGATGSDWGGTALQRYEALKRKRRGLLRAAHASCWRWGDESEAMWRIYCPGKYGIAICSTFETLKNSIRDASTVVSPIAYINYKTGSFVRHEHDYDPALHKRKAFEHEQEVRVLRFRTEDFKRAFEDDSYSAPERVEIDWDPETVVERIVVNPRCPDWYLEEVRAAVNRRSVTLANKVQESGLAAPPGW